MKAPAEGLDAEIQTMEDAYRAFRSRQSGQAKSDARSAMLRKATGILTSLLPDDDRRDVVITIGVTGGVPHLIATRSQVVRTQAPLIGSAMAALADILTQILQRRALSAYVDAVGNAGGDVGRAWEDGVLHHPAMLMLEHVSGRPAPAGTRTRRSGLFIGGRASGAIGRGEVILNIGAPATDWSKARATRIHLGVSLPETILALLPGMRLAELVEGRTADHHIDAYNSLVIAEATGSVTGSRTAIVLEPALQEARGDGDVAQGAIEAWKGLLLTRVRV